MPKSSNFSVHYHDFHPSNSTKEYIESILTTVQNELPGGARAKATFFVKDKVVKGTLQIGSYYGSFFGSAVAGDLHMVTMKLVEQVRRRLKKFKSKRRSHDGLKQSLKRIAYSPEPIGTDAVA